MPSLDDYVHAEIAVEALRSGVAGAALGRPAPLPDRPHHRASAPRGEVVIRGEPRPARSAMRATIPFDLTGSPALSLPFTLSGEGLPIGVQLVGRRFEDRFVLAAGAALEAARGRCRVLTV